ncbi:MAG: TRAP transporter substrate-binding protein DctP [Acidobacteriota bacterium]
MIRMPQRTRGDLARRMAAVVAFAAVLLPGAADAQILIKMATLVPDGSSWHQVLKETAAEWNRVSGGKVRVNLYAGGTAGDDPDVVRKMTLGTLNAAVLTSVGVAEIDKSVYAMSIPMAYRDYDEVYYVLEKMRPSLEASMLEKGYVVLNWADGGWVHYFAKRPVTDPDDLRSLKLFSWAGDTDTLEIWRNLRFNPVPLPSTELATALQTGLVEAFGAPPQVAVITRYYENAKNMTDLNWALLLGATVIKKEVWERIPADIRPKLLEVARNAGRKLQAEVRRSGEADVAAMKSKGLNVVPVDAPTRAQWTMLAESTYPQVRGHIVPAAAFDEALRYRDEYRKQQAAHKK